MSSQDLSQKGQNPSQDPISEDSRIFQILSFWFDPSYSPTRWFIPSNNLDSAIRAQFSSLIDLARSPSPTNPLMNAWTTTPNGTLALLLLLDQFPRNIYRGSSESYASDAQALDVARIAVEKGWDRACSTVQQTFFYLPFVHTEDISVQHKAVSLYESWLERCRESEASAEPVPSSTTKIKVSSLDPAAEMSPLQFATIGLEMSQRHRKVIERFGRFPARNEVMERESSEEEKIFLKENPSGF